MLTKRQQLETLPNKSLIRVGSTAFAIVDPEDYDRINRHHWRLVRSAHCFYAVRREQRNGRIRHFKMHRSIAHCPAGFEVHHINHNPLDNRKDNLMIVTPAQHRLLEFKA